MDKRAITKMAVKLVVGTTVGSFVTKTFNNNIPTTEKFKISEMTGVVAGAAVAQQLEPTTDELVDAFFDRREAKKHS